MFDNFEILLSTFFPSCFFITFGGTRETLERGYYHQWDCTCWWRGWGDTNHQSSVYQDLSSINEEGLEEESLKYWSFIEPILAHLHVHVLLKKILLLFSIIKSIFACQKTTSKKLVLSQARLVFSKLITHLAKENKNTT